MVSGAIQGREWQPSLQFGVEANEYEAFRSPSTTIGSLNLIIYIYEYIVGRIYNIN